MKRETGRVKSLEILTENKMLTELGYLTWQTEDLGTCCGCSQILAKLSSGRDWAHPVKCRGLRQMGFNKEKSVCTITDNKISMNF